MSDSCVITWDAPTSDGGAKVIGYFIERRVGHNQNWVKINTRSVAGLSFHVVDLVEEQSYEFRVIAENREGAGQPSQGTQPIKARNPWSRPSAPGPITVQSATKSSVNLRWSPPTSDGGDSIKHYLVEYRPVGGIR